jgi:hypothetical protein
MNSAGEWNVFRTRFLVRARKLNEPFIFTDALGREQSGVPGDYLVESSDGITRITARALFEDIYVPLVPTLLLPPAPDVDNARTPRQVSASRATKVMSRSLSRAAPDLRSYPFPLRSRQAQGCKTHQQSLVSKDARINDGAG